MRWVKNAQGRFDLVVVPLHGRGNNPGAGTGEGVKILAYKMPADPKGTWTTQLLDASMHKTHNFDPVQWDNEAAQELLIAGKEGVFLLNQTENKSFQSRAGEQAAAPSPSRLRLWQL